MASPWTLDAGDEGRTNPCKPSSHHTSTALSSACVHFSQDQLPFWLFSLVTRNTHTRCLFYSTKQSSTVWSLSICFPYLCHCVCVCVCVCVYTCMRIQGKQTHPSTFQLPFHRLTEVALYPARHRQVQCVPPCYFSRFLQNEINHYSITPRSCARAKAHHPEMLS